MIVVPKRHEQGAQVWATRKSALRSEADLQVPAYGRSGSKSSSREGVLSFLSKDVWFSGFLL